TEEEGKGQVGTRNHQAAATGQIPRGPIILLPIGSDVLYCQPVGSLVFNGKSMEIHFHEFRRGVGVGYCVQTLSTDKVWCTRWLSGIKTASGGSPGPVGKAQHLDTLGYVFGIRI